jgi:nucleotidyltransferase substrate binding protein (TIGR01987 family)
MKANPEAQKKIQVALENLKSVLVGLKEGCNQSTVSNLELSGTIHHFEFCHELSWKLLQKRAAQDGRTIASPREAFRYGFEGGYIENDKAWAELRCGHCKKDLQASQRRLPG